MRVNTEVKFKCFVVISVILASVIGIYGQTMTYYIVDNIFTRGTLSTVACITSLTILSILLFLVSSMATFVGIKQSKLREEVFSKYLFVDLILGCLISLWSVLIITVWWG